MSRVTHFTIILATLEVAQVSLARQSGPPLLKLLPRFSAPGVPAMGLGETEAPPLAAAAPVPPRALYGARHLSSFVSRDESRDRV